MKSMRAPALSIFGDPWITENALSYCGAALSSREPASTSLEKALADGAAGRFAFVASEVAEDDDVAFGQRGD